MKHTIRTLVISALVLPGLAACAGPAGQRTPMVDTGMSIDPIPAATPEAQRSLDLWITGFRPRALTAGITPTTFDRAMTGIRYNPKVIERDRNQSEFTKAIWEYLDTAVSDTRIDNGRRALAEHGAVLRQIEARYGVEKEVVAAVWGMESSYGSFRGKTQVLPALATLAHDGRRGAFFEQQLIAALKIVQAGDVAPEAMTGSWAGAMGHTQFIPTSYLSFAVDFTGDGRRDIWSDNPADALASTAAYLARSGWVKGQPWGVEVQLPQGFDFTEAGKKVKKSAADWAALGVRGVDGGRVPDHGTASILLPAGARGPAFMIFGNFTAISRYNSADSYVIGVGHLSDRLAGRGPIRSPWPRGDRALNLAERQELQQRLTGAGFDTQGTDGKIGPNTVAAIEAFQRARGLTADGYPSAALLAMLR
ncbi:murein transglycosylase [Rhodobacter veldkampii DSM 11550]|uniref:Lytic murein transglycosylase n=1 Tax=Phaeovulum veldkampii DSM 11550 TaxID=1185920 RepID=A0A2T4JHV2_9RHOB|nr:murein transglycosylase [Phaeovulum veldkampii DSM 11550]PTE17482.1 lytic murein transglycosylase [Phaeovulum veldkampii DSM 11550]TDQ60146.1 lytic murein transglycosylase [Phaeovulum veldkampii DSM 11550]